jgi:hypothetical protein
MVPLGAPARYLYLRDGKSLTVTDTVPLLAITEINEAALPSRYGKRPKGVERVRYRDGRSGIAVKNRLVKTAAFQFVKRECNASASNLQIDLRRPLAGVTSSIYIYQPCKVEIRCESAKGLTLTEDLGDCVGVASHAPSDWHTLKALRDTTVNAIPSSCGLRKDRASPRYGERRIAEGPMDCRSSKTMLPRSTRILSRTRSGTCWGYRTFQTLPGSII